MSGKKRASPVLQWSVPNHLAEEYLVGHLSSFSLKPWCPQHSEGIWQWKEHGFLIQLDWVWILVAHLLSLCLTELLKFTVPHLPPLSNGHSSIWGVSIKRVFFLNEDKAQFLAHVRCSGKVRTLCPTLLPGITPRQGSDKEARETSLPTNHSVTTL